MSYELRIVHVEPGADSEPLIEILRSTPADTGVLLHSSSTAPDGPLTDALRSAADAALAASANPLPLVGAGDPTRISSLELAPPTIAASNPALTLIVPRALQSVRFDAPPGTTVAELLERWSADAVRMGWRHVATPQVAARAPVPVGDAARRYAETVEGPGNELLATHRLWAQTRSRLRLAIDGACFRADAQSTGTYQLVLALVDALAAVRPDADIVVALPEAEDRELRTRLAPRPNIRFAPRTGPERFDVVYRPYQFLRVDEIGWTFEAGARVLLAQLDMIGFSNAAYHPRTEMFDQARNVQRATLRRADVVTTISRHSRETLTAECPDLEASRVVVVRCGTDHVWAGQTRRPEQLPIGVERFLTCLSSTFWHKNRPHAIATFAALRRRGWDGHLVIAGPEPYYGRSSLAEDDLISALPAADRAGVHRLGSVGEPEKWWLLANAAVALYPSISEGFGLVPFEAASVGTPALAGHAGSIPEVLGNDVRLAPSWRADDWADIVEEWLHDPAAADRQVQAVLERSRTLTWELAARQTWAAVDLALSLPRRTPLGHDGGHRSAMETHGLGPSAIANLLRHGRRVTTYIERRSRAALGR